MMTTMLKIAFILITTMILSCKSAHIEIAQENSNQLELKNITATPELGVIYNTDSTTIKFKGVITKIKYDCRVDATCSIEVNDKWWIAIIYGKRGPSRIPKERGLVTGIRFFPEDPKIIGKRVNVFAKIRDKNRLTVEGSKEYYVKVIE